MKTNYSLSVMWSEEDESFVALCPEFPGLSAFGETYSEAVAEIESALSASIEVCKEEGDNLPDARLLPEHSGQFRIRIPKYLHTSLVLEAERQGVSLNTLVQTYLAQGVAQSAAEDYITQLRNRLSGLCENMISSWYKATFSKKEPKTIENQYTYSVEKLSWVSDDNRGHTGEIQCLALN